ncbi:MAG TPA: MFS transporter [Gaiellaceae bacterium]
MLRSRPFIALLAAEIVSTTGSQLSWLAVPWFVLVTTGSPSRMGIVLAAEFLGTAIFGIPSSRVAARLGARNTLLACDLVRAPLVALVPLLHAAGALSFPVLVAIVFCLGALFTPSYSSQRVVLPELFGEDDRLLGQANALLRGTTASTVLIGPPVAGVLIAALGASTVLWIDAATFLVSFAIVALFVPAGSRAPEGEDARGVFAGLRFLWRDRLLRPWTVGGACFELGWQALFAAIPVIAFVRYGDPKVAGWLFASFGAGGILGSVLVVPALKRIDSYRLVVLAKIPQLAVLWLLALDLPAVWIAPALAAASFLGSFVTAPVTGVQSARAPASVRPHVMAAYLTITLLAGMIGLASAGPTLEHIGFQAVFVGLAAVHTAGAVPFVAASLRERALSGAAGGVSPPASGESRA